MQPDRQVQRILCQRYAVVQAEQLPPSALGHGTNPLAREALLDCALAELGRSEGIQIRSIVGINHDGVFGSTRAGWHPDLPDACKEPFVPVLWLQVLELLGRVPEGSTARFVQDGTLPD